MRPFPESQRLHSLYQSAFGWVQSEDMPEMKEALLVIQLLPGRESLPDLNREPQALIQYLWRCGREPILSFPPLSHLNCTRRRKHLISILAPDCSSSCLSSNPDLLPQPIFDYPRERERKRERGRGREKPLLRLTQRAQTPQDKNVLELFPAVCTATHLH